MIPLIIRRYCTGQLISELSAIEDAAYKLSATSIVSTCTLDDTRRIHSPWILCCSVYDGPALFLAFHPGLACRGGIHRLAIDELRIGAVVVLGGVLSGIWGKRCGRHCDSR